ncbi:adenosine receptor A1-like [Liolophura sinensis]|uniref:adenosine receptor A1-like n=1 Tax=Liolophura sinensis TaxID=3198878 RepID=UPI00315882EE
MSSFMDRINSLENSTRHGFNKTFCHPDGNTSSVETFQLQTLMYIIPEVLLIILVAFGNILVLVAVWRFRELQTSTNIFVVNLAIADLSVALFILPLHITIFIIPALKSVFVICMLRYCGIFLSTGSSGLILLLISIDRFIAIEKPYSYPTIMTTRVSKFLCAAAWTFVLGYASLPLLGWNDWTPCVRCTFSIVLPSTYVTFIMCYVFIDVIIIGAINAKIFHTANKVSRQISGQAASVSGERNDSKYKTMFLKNKKAAKGLLLVFGVFSICVLPFTIFTLWEIHALDSDSREKYDIVRIFTTFMGIANSAMNPVIYHRRMPQFRIAFRKLLNLKSMVNSQLPSDELGPRS